MNQSKYNLKTHNKIGNRTNTQVNYSDNLSKKLTYLL